MRTVRYPSTEAEIRACGCQSCRIMTVIWDRCDEYAEPLFVSDGRMPTQEAAFDAVLNEFGQRHCDAFVSSWPLMPAGALDFAYHGELYG